MQNVTELQRSAGRGQGDMAPGRRIPGENDMAFVAGHHRLSMIREAILRAGLLVGGVFTALILAEVAVRTFAPQKLYRYPRGMYVAHPTLGYTLEPNFRGDLDTSEFRTEIATNSLGLRSDREYGPKDARTFRIMVLGDSFAMGVGVNERETFERLLERDLNASADQRRFEVINAGVPSYSTREATLYFEETGATLTPDLVLLSFFIGNDILDNARDKLPRVVNGELAAAESRSGFLPVPVRRFLARRLHLYQLVWPIQHRLFPRSAARDDTEKEAAAIYELSDRAQNTRAWTETDRWLARLSADTDAHRMALAVLLVPDPLQLDPAAWDDPRDGTQMPQAKSRTYPNERLTQSLRRLGVATLDLLPQLEATPERWHFRVDGHWTPSGHQRVESALLTFLRSEGLVPGPSQASPPA